MVGGVLHAGLLWTLAQSGDAAHSPTLVRDIGVCIVAATLLAYLARLTKQPLLLAYIAAGVVIGPVGAKIVHDRESIEAIADLGLAFLLFIVGLEIDIKKMIDTGRLAALATVVQVGGSWLLGWLVAKMMGYHGLPAVYLAGAVCMSSTMIVLKLLADRAEVQSVAGQITLGILLFQDVAAIAALAIQPNLGTPGGGAANASGASGFAAIPWLMMLLAALRGLGLVAGAVLLTRFILPPLFRWVAKSPELLLLSAVTWCFIVCGAAMWLQFSIAMGALIAGVSLAAFPYTIEVVAKVRGLRDFFVTLFFVALGMLLTPPTPGILVTALVLALAVIASRFLTVWPILRLMRYPNRIGVLSSIHLAQISEFALVLALIGSAPLHKDQPPHISQDVVSIIVILLIITSTTSTYMIQYSQKLASLLVPRATDRKGDEAQSTVLARDGEHPPIMLVGCFRTGSSLIHELRQAAIDFKVIDFNQRINEQLNQLGVPTTYGDISNMDTLEHAGVEHARILVATIPDDFLRGTDNLHLLSMLRKLNPGAKIIVTAESMARALKLYQAGADYVLVSRVNNAQHLMEVIAEIGAGMLDARREIQVRHLGERVEVVP